MAPIPLTPQLKEKARLLSLAGDTTRIRILCFLFAREEACVSEIAEAVDMSVAAVSHHLQMMKDNSMVQCRRVGQTMCYQVVDSPFTRQLRTIIC